MPNFPCSDTSEQLSLKKHLMYKHNLSNTAANKIVLDRMNNHIDEKQTNDKNDLIFNNTQELFSHSVHWHKGRCPFSYGFNNVFNLTLSNHHIKNYNCRHIKQCLLLSHLRVSHNLNIKSAKKIVKTMMSSSIESKQKSTIENDIREIILFQKDDAVLNTNPFRHYCPLTNVTSIINEDIQDQTLLNVPCNKTNEKFILFAHLQHYHQMSGELALRLIRSIRTSTETTVINDFIITNNNKQSTTTNTTVADEIDIVPYKCLCPYSTTLNSGNSNLLKKFLRFVKNIPCDRPCPVNLYRHLRNYHKVDLQYAKDITRTIMLSKTIKSEISTEDNRIDQQNSTSIRKRTKLPKSTSNYGTTISLSRICYFKKNNHTLNFTFVLVHMNLNSVNSEMKNESIDFLIDNENPEDWDSSMINDEESLFLSFDEDRLNNDDIEKDF
ncbi:unnamed protein product [Rotaria sp. Silwood2]|nr:unnamed protein product [Rotaria sp. Silwood2]CAF3976148.1 unnamed protein product [Rotaria sp. Silwood2]CAF4172986.1 unnamed protein product [Rotaria sp. Silwood2]CAF4538353.1 unnamed protein product [Rotaria sp. Silwood2]